MRTQCPAQPNLGRFREIQLQERPRSPRAIRGTPGSGIWVNVLGHSRPTWSRRRTHEDPTGVPPGISHRLLRRVPGGRSLRVRRCPTCNWYELIMALPSWPSNWRTAATSLSRSPTGATSTSASSMSGTTSYWPSRRPASAQATCSSIRTARSWAVLNLYRIGEGTAEVGYRIAQRIAGRGVATAALRKLCKLAASRYGLDTLKAATSDQNLASQRVLIKAGFIPAEPADPADIGGKRGRWYRCDLTSGGPDQPVWSAT